MKLYQFEYPIAVMSHVLAVSSSGYYAWLNRKPSVRAQCDAILEVHVKAAHEAARQTYGDERLHAELEANGIVFNLQSTCITSKARTVLPAEETLQMHHQQQSQ